MRLVKLLPVGLMACCIWLMPANPALANKVGRGNVDTQAGPQGIKLAGSVESSDPAVERDRRGTGAREASTAARQPESKRTESKECQLEPDGTCLITDVVVLSGPGAPPPPDPRVLVQQAVLRMQIPAPTARVGPDPTVNEWKMAVVGYPLWLWTDGPDRHDAAVTEQGITLSLTARRVTTRFDLGDGAVKFCGLTTPYYWGVAPAAESPSCGYRYRMPSPKGGAYAVSATTVWEVTWSGLGQSGTLPLERTGPITRLPVGELVSVRTGG